MYEVNINAEPGQFLDWDKVLAQHPTELADKVMPMMLNRERIGREAGASILARDIPYSKPELVAKEQARRDLIRARAETPPEDYVMSRSGKDVYMSAGAPMQSQIEGFPRASANLFEMGVPGIKYLDQGSRGAGEGTSNYVVFNDKLIDILK